MHCRQVLRILEACNNSERQKTTRRLLHTVLYSSQLNSSENFPLFYHFYLSYNDRNIMCLWPWCESNTWKNILLFSSRLVFFTLLFYILHFYLLSFCIKGQVVFLNNCIARSLSDFYVNLARNTVCVFNCFYVTPY